MQVSLKFYHVVLHVRDSGIILNYLSVSVGAF